MIGQASTERTPGMGGGEGRGSGFGHGPIRLSCHGAGWVEVDNDLLTIIIENIVMDENQTIRILIPGNLDNDSISNAISVANKLCKQYAETVHDVILFIPSRKNILGTTLTSILGESVSKRLHKGEAVRLPCGKGIRLETIRTLTREFKKSIVVAIYADNKMMDQADSMKNLFAIVAVPHMEGALEGWKRTWSPFVFGEEKSDDEVLVSDPVIESALSSLTSLINLSHTILNQTDKEHTETIIRILRRYKHIEDSSNVRAWAVKHQWHPKAADELKRIWDKIYSLKNKPNISDLETAKHRYEYWKSNAK